MNSRYTSNLARSVTPVMSRLSLLNLKFWGAVVTPDGVMMQSPRVLSGRQVAGGLYLGGWRLPLHDMFANQETGEEFDSCAALCTLSERAAIHWVRPMQSKSMERVHGALVQLAFRGFTNPVLPEEGRLEQRAWVYGVSRERTRTFALAAFGENQRLTFSDFTMAGSREYQLSFQENRFELSLLQCDDNRFSVAA